MAGDWLKMTHALPEKPEVLAIAGRTGLNRFEVVGRLFILWRWFDNNTVDGNASGVTSVTLQECLFGYGDVTSFVSAVVAARWLVENDEGVSVVKFDEHTSESAKQRAQTAKRVAKSKKNAKGNADNGNKVTLSALPDALPREEKRREEENTPPTPKGGEAGADVPSPTKAGAICRAIKAKGVHGLNTSNPELLALIEKGVTVETFEAAAEVCARSNPPKGMGYLLAIVKRQLAEASSIAGGPAAVAQAADPDSRSAIEAEGVSMGIGKWNEIAEQWHVYKARVRGKQPAGLNLSDLSNMAAQRQGVH